MTVIFSSLGNLNLKNRLAVFVSLWSCLSGIGGRALPLPLPAERRFFNSDLGLGSAGRGGNIKKANSKNWGRDAAHGKGLTWLKAPRNNCPHHKKKFGV